METEKTFFADANSIFYEQAKRLLNYVSKNLKGDQLDIYYNKKDDTSTTNCLLNNEAVRVSFELSNLPGFESISISFDHWADKDSYDITITVGEHSSLFYLIPPSIIVGLKQSVKFKEDLEITI